MAKKKAQTIPLVTFIGLIVAVLIITTFVIAGIRGCNLVYATSNSKVLQGIIDISESVATAKGDRAGDIRTYQVKLDSDSAIIGMNAGKPFHYESKDISVKSMYHMDFPAQCNDKETCVCLCEGIEPKTIPNSDYPEEGAYISCSTLTCKSADFQISEKIPMTSVFDKPKDSKVSVGEGYWDNSFILLRSSTVSPEQIISVAPTATTDSTADKIQNTEPTDHTGAGKIVDEPVDVAGYRVFEFTDAKVGVTILRDDNKKISICMKKDCIAKTN